MDNKFKPETLCVQAGWQPKKGEPRVLPIYQSTTFKYETSEQMDKYLDDAYIAHMKSVRIVHGKGTGALRKGVHNYLKRQKHVASFRLGEFGEGDAGVTIVEFKK